MADVSTPVNSEQSSVSFDLADGAYTTNEVNIPTIDLSRKHSFLVRAQTLNAESDLVMEGRLDPVTRKPFSSGDKVLILSTTDDGKNLSATFSPQSLAFIHPDVTFTQIEEGVIEDKAKN